VFVSMCVCCVWDSLDQVSESEVAARGFVLCVCVCVGVLRLGQFGTGLGV